ncbi:MAG TPA: phosphoglycerate mutase family protein [Pyrinomonadaceae bacterium]
MLIDPRWKKRLALISMATGLIVIIACIVIFWRGSTTVILVVRHAERNDLESCSPATVKGRPNPTLALTAGVSARAQALAHVGGEDSIAAIYASEFCRSQQTVQPLANQLGLTVNVVDQFEADGTTVNVDGLIEQIWANNTGQVILVVGHNNTVPVIVEELSGVSIEAINETDFDNLYMVVVPRWWGRTKVVRLKYGAPT